jgi:hypothetical protein
MVDAKVPYVTAYGNITKTLEKIKKAATPDRFTQDFLATKLGLKGGSPKPVIPFLKRTGFLGSDGVPSDLYRRFRNSSESAAAAFQALRTGYQVLFEANEYAHDLSDKDLRSLIVSQLGLEGNSTTATSILGSFKALRTFTEGYEEDASNATEVAPITEKESPKANPSRFTEFSGMAIGYTINLNLPATADIAVFNAIFKSIREHLIPDS